MTLRLADIHPNGYPTAEAVKYFGSLLEKKTNGRYKVQIFHSAQLGQEKDTIEQTRFCVIDLTRINMEPFNNSVPETLVPSLPFIVRSVEHMRKAMDGSIGDQILKAFDSHGLVALAFYDSGARSFYDSFRHFEGAKYYSLIQHSMSPEVLVMSKKSFDELSPEDQKVVRDLAFPRRRHLRAAACYLHPRDEASGDLKRAGDPVSGLVYPFRRRHQQLCFRVGHGR